MSFSLSYEVASIRLIRHVLYKSNIWKKKPNKPDQQVADLGVGGSLAVQEKLA